MSAEQCQLPARWEGSWFQSGVHQTITINRSTISTKGRCLESEGEKYLLKNEKDNCFRCVVFHEKHLNVLQYKETFCIPDRSPLRTICSTISGDANLFSMFRLDGAPIDCPFKGPLTFTYNRGHGDCRYPVSTIESCIHPSRVLLNYQACPDIPGTESAVEELQCLAAWKEGSFRYLVGLIQYRHHASYEERFRCFAYEKSKKGGVFSGNYGNFANNSAVSLALGSTSKDSASLVSVPAGGTSSVAVGSMSTNSNNNNNQQNDLLFRVAMSGDASCNGLLPNEGSRTMLFKKGSTPKPCQFPSWVQAHTQWHTLDQRSTYAFDSSTLRVSNSSDPTGISPSTLSMTAVCHQILDNPTLDKVMLVLQSTSEW
ncbi:hypothetical protein Ocin01_06191 [Orchesella cincta]|uniref:Uncharacterized protein n=1 Tax=Orchesella cincta TaxID=48709 RepID=A0A1D2N5D2_ORCCI|nr:hypothetical protein Ocin01_06191 [Orchesella cincta]